MELVCEMLEQLPPSVWKNKDLKWLDPANGIGNFYYAPPSGYLALCTANLPEPTIGANSDTQADDYFNSFLFTFYFNVLVVVLILIIELILSNLFLLQAK